MRGLSIRDRQDGIVVRPAGLPTISDNNNSTLNRSGTGRRRTGADIPPVTPGGQLEPDIPQEMPVREIRR